MDAKEHDQRERVSREDRISAAQNALYDLLRWHYDKPGINATKLRQMMHDLQEMRYQDRGKEHER